jgi:hypothetical protein
MKSLQDKDLFGPIKHEDSAKKHLKQIFTKKGDEYVINKDIDNTVKGEENIGTQRVCVGGIILAPRKIGEKYAAMFNERQFKHIQEDTMQHKILCERRDEASALIFLTADDFLRGYDGKEISSRDLCTIIRQNMYNIVTERFPLLVEYSKNIVYNYYDIHPKKLKIKLNFIMDDGVYEDNVYKKKTYITDHIYGGLLINGLIEELLYYQRLGDEYDFGIICQVLAPSGLPENKKWAQIDVGISFAGKRLYKENIVDAMVRESKEEIHIELLDQGIKTRGSMGFPWTNKLYYGGMPNGKGCHGFEIHVWEVLYENQIRMADEIPLNYSFCRCKERNKLISHPRGKKYKKKNKSRKKLKKITVF